MPIAGRVALCVVLCCSAIAAACSGRVLKPQYEYEEELYLNLDGSAITTVNAVAQNGVPVKNDTMFLVFRISINGLSPAR